MTGRFPGLVFLTAVLLLAGCASRAVRGGGETDPPDGPDVADQLHAFPLEASEQRAFQEIPEHIIESGGRTWVVMPRTLFAIRGQLVEWEVGLQDGLLGAVLSLDHDDDTLWLGTTGGVNEIDTRALYLQAYIAPDSEDVAVRWLDADENLDLWLVTPGGIAWLDRGSRTWRRYAFARFSFAAIRTVLFDGRHVWFATASGLHRFSREWRAWDPLPGSRELAKTEIFDLERDEAGRLWCLAAGGLFLYSGDFDSWQFVGR